MRKDVWVLVDVFRLCDSEGVSDEKGARMCVSVFWCPKKMNRIHFLPNEKLTVVVLSLVLFSCNDILTNKLLYFYSGVLTQQVRCLLSLAG